jgi:hypothetical protein
MAVDSFFGGVGQSVVTERSDSPSPGCGPLRGIVRLDHHLNKPLPPINLVAGRASAARDK